MELREASLGNWCPSFEYLLYYVCSVCSTTGGRHVQVTGAYPPTRVSQGQWPHFVPVTAGSMKSLSASTAALLLWYVSGNRSHSLTRTPSIRPHVPDYNFGAHRHATCHSVSNLGSEDYIHDSTQAPRPMTVEDLIGSMSHFRGALVPTMPRPHLHCSTV